MQHTKAVKLILNYLNVIFELLDNNWCSGVEQITPTHLVGGWVVVCLGGPTCRGCGVGFICGGGGLAYTTEAGCPGGNEGCECGRKGRIGSCIDKCLDDAC